MTIVAKTHQGLVRGQNEDAFFFRAEDGLMVIADGLGGHNHGRICSQMAVDQLASHQALLAVTEVNQIAGAMADCNLALINHQKTSAKHEGMRTTLTCAAMTPENELIYAWAGDSRIYRFSQQEGLLQLTRDHTLLQQRKLAGIPSKLGDAHILTKSVGGNQVFDADKGHVKLDQGDLIVLTTDGLTSIVSDHDLERMIASTEIDLEGTADALIQLALSRGGPDNITVMLCRVPKR